MYEKEEKLIEEAERLTAQATTSSPRTERGAGVASDVSAIQQAITEWESAESMISSVYETLRSRVPAEQTDVNRRREELLPRAWNALLLVEREKNFLINGLYHLQSEANRPNEHH
jgi:hypothetical protein